MPLINKVIWLIEVHLDEPIDLAWLADRCAVNVHHMCRAFQIGTGLSIMGYVRVRRLSRAARHIAEAPDADLLQVALTAGYGSHEAFTRAFRAYLGVLPSDVKKVGSVKTLTLMEPLEMDKTMIVDVAAPKMRTRDGFRVAGLNLACQGGDISGIPALWQKFNQHAHAIGGPGPAYGISHAMAKHGDFQYFAGMEAPHAPDGMETLDIPAHRYAVFTHRGHIGDLPKTIYTIWNKALPDAGMEPAPAPEFEVYDARFNIADGRGEIEVWVPIQA